MAGIRDLTNAIDALLRHPLGASQYRLAKNTGDVAYEAYVFGLCLRAVRELGVVPVLKGVTGLPNPFIFRGAPGQIYGTSKNFGYAEFTLNNHTFEIHVDVEFKGSSSMMHELDVCIIRGEDANDCRLQHRDPTSAALVGAWECKFYGGRLDKALGRTFVGLMTDMGTNVRLSGLCSNTQEPQLKDFLKSKNGPYPHLCLMPHEKSNEDIFVNALKKELKQMTSL
jgi:hypothetical protein